MSLFHHVPDRRSTTAAFVARISLPVLLLTAAACGDTASDGPADDQADAGGQAGADGSGGELDGGQAGADAGAAGASCEPGFAGCVDGKRVVCNEAGTAFGISACPKDKVCFAGKCADCGTNKDCDEGQVCDEGKCATPTLEIVTESLPTAVVSQAYSVQLEASGGVKPYTWKLDQGVLPDGILVSSEGVVKGSPTKEAKQSVAIGVTDKDGAFKSRIYTLEVKAGGLVITTSAPLPKATEGKKYSAKLQAQGGNKPYFWGLKSGKLPAGLNLTADGAVSGTPTKDGTFNFEIKALDDSTPTLSTTKAFELTVKLAPLEIVGTQQINLLITKIIVLPLIIIVKDVPVPYSNKLEATGGKKPYTWTEEPLPGAVKSFLPKSGIPKGLKLAKDGALSGAVTDPTLAAEVKIPLSQITLKGFFFAAKVTDSQDKAQSKTALFIIPTTPVNL